MLSHMKVLLLRIKVMNQAQFDIFQISFCEYHAISFQNSGLQIQLSSQ